MNQGTILGNQIGKWITLAVLVAVLAALLTAGVIRSDGHSTEIDYAEEGEGAVLTFTATDPEDATPIAWHIATATQVGAEDDLVDADNTDAADFMIDKDGMLKFSSPPDFENPADADTDNTYKVVVVACDVALVSEACPDSPAGQAGYHKVTVKVTKVDEAGKVTWTVDPAGTPGADVLGSADMPIMQFAVGAELTATAEDGDITNATQTFTADVADEVTGVTWRWYRGNTEISGQTTNAYTVTTDDVGHRIRATVYYVVAGNTAQETASLTSDYPVLAARTADNKLKFEPAMLEGTVAENSDKGTNVGAPVRATGNYGAVNYTLVTGNDAAKFKIDKKTGQITTNAEFDFEADAADTNCADNDDECVVMVRATDASGSATAATAGTNIFVDATVTIKITDVDEKPTFVTDGTGPPAADSPMAITSVEDRTPLFPSGTPPTTSTDVTYAATDPEGLNVNLSLMGTDGAKFSLSSAGVLSFKEKPDYEMPADANEDNVYEVTVRASAGTLNEDRMVKVTVTNVDEAPDILRSGLRVSGRSSLNYAENGTEAVGTYTASGTAAASARWMLEGDDADDFRLSSSSGMSTMLMFSSPPNYEMPRGMAMSDTNTNTYMVTVKASYGSGAEMGMDTQDVTVYVTNEEEGGMVALSSMSPMVGDEVTATLTDPDGGVTGEIWQWSRSMTMDGTFMDIIGATSASYTPLAGDDGYYLRVTVRYTDAYGDDMAMETTAMAVTSNRPPAFDMDSTTRTVAENTAAGMNIGDPVTATDPDGDTLTYALSGTDAASFDIGMSTGQLMTKAALDYETKMSYMVTVTATDGDGESDSIEVTINVTDVEEDPVLAMFDANKDGSIDRSEVIMAIDRYLDGETGVTRDDVIAAINRYLDS